MDEPKLKEDSQNILLPIVEAEPFVIAGDQITEVGDADADGDSGAATPEPQVASVSAVAPSRPTRRRKKKLTELGSDDDDDDDINGDAGSDGGDDDFRPDLDVGKKGKSSLTRNQPYPYATDKQKAEFKTFLLNAPREYREHLGRRGKDKDTFE